MTDQNTNALWGQLRSLTHEPLEDSLTNDYGRTLSPDAERAVEVADLLNKFSDAEREAARDYAQKALQRVGVDSELFRTAVRYTTPTDVKGALARFFASARDGYLGQVYTSDYQGHVQAYYLDDGVLYKTDSSYGSCSHCCSFQRAYETSRGAQVLESFRLQGVCKVVHENPHPDDVKHLVELCHEAFVLRHGDWNQVNSFYKDDSWQFNSDFEDLSPEEDEDEEEDYYNDDYWTVR